MVDSAATTTKFRSLIERFDLAECTRASIESSRSATGLWQAQPRSIREIAVWAEGHRRTFMDLDRIKTYGISGTRKAWITNPVRSIAWRLMLPYFQGIADEI